MPLLSVATGVFLCFIQITDCEVMLSSPVIQPASQQTWVQVPGKPIAPGTVFCTAIITCNQALPYFLCVKRDIPSEVSWNVNFDDQTKILTSNISSVSLLLSLEDSGVFRLGSAPWQLLNVLGFVIALVKHNNGFLRVAKCLLRSCNKKRNVPFYLSVNKYWTKEPNTGLICTHAITTSKPLRI